MAVAQINHNKALAAIAVLVFIWFVAALHRSDALPSIPPSPPPKPAATSLPSPPSSSSGAMYLSGEEAEDYCRRYRLPTFDAERLPRRKVYDLLLVNTELEMLEVRLGEMYAHVDYFVILESDITFTGNAKPLHIRDNWDLFSAFHDKMILRTVDMSGLPPDPTTWDREHTSRNAMLEQVIPFLEGPQEASLDDVLLVSDVDEIPKPAVLVALRACDFPARTTISSDFYYYSFQWLSREEWTHPQATTYRGAEDTVAPKDLRHQEGDYNFKHGAWHCSYCFSSMKETVGKVLDFSHQELNKEEFKDPAKILERVRFGSDFYDRKDNIFDYIANNLNIPAYVNINAERFGFMLDRNLENANFKDVPLDGNVAGLKYE